MTPDHPLTVAGEAFTAVTMFRLFFVIRANPFPRPQLMLLLSLCLLANLLARVSHADWFVASDIVFFWVWPLAVTTSIFSLQKRQAVEDSRPGAVVRIPDMVDRWQVQLTWGFSLIVVGAILYGYVQSWTERQEASKEADRRVLAENTRAKKEAALKDSISIVREKAYKDSVLREIASLKQPIQALATGQGKILKGQAIGRALIVEKSALTRKTIERSRQQSSPVQKLEPAPAPKPKPTFWQKINPFGIKRLPDSLIYVHANPYEL